MTQAHAGRGPAGETGGRQARPLTREEHQEGGTPWHGRDVKREGRQRRGTDAGQGEAGPGPVPERAGAGAQLGRAPPPWAPGFRHSQPCSGPTVR